MQSGKRNPLAWHAAWRRQGGGGKGGGGEAPRVRHWSGPSSHKQAAAVYLSQSHWRIAVDGRHTTLGCVRVYVLCQPYFMALKRQSFMGAPIFFQSEIKTPPKPDNSFWAKQTLLLTSVSSVSYGPKRALGSWLRREVESSFSSLRHAACLLSW